MPEKDIVSQIFFFFSTDCLAPGVIFFSLRLISSLRRSRLEENLTAVLCIYLLQRVLFSNSFLPSGLLHRAGSTHLPCRARPLLASMARPPAWSPFCSLSPSELAPSPCFSASVARPARISLRAGFSLSLPSSPPFPATRSLVPALRAPAQFLCRGSKHRARLLPAQPLLPSTLLAPAAPSARVPLVQAPISSPHLPLRPVQSVCPCSSPRSSLAMAARCRLTARPCSLRVPGSASVASPSSSARLPLRRLSARAAPSCLRTRRCQVSSAWVFFPLRSVMVTASREIPCMPAPMPSSVPGSALLGSYCAAPLAPLLVARSFPAPSEIG
jgi:hypothetical protein